MAYSSTRRQPPPRSWGNSGAEKPFRGGNDGPDEYSKPLNDPKKPQGYNKRPSEKEKMIEDGPRNVHELDLETVMKRLLCLSAVQVSAGILSVISGIIALIYAWPMKQFPGASAVPIWAGAIVIASASCGIHAARQKTTVFSELIKNLVMAQFILACISFVTTGLQLGWSAWINWDCGKETPADWCLPNDRELYGVAIFCIICAIFQFFITVPIASIYFFLRHNFYNQL